MVTARDKLICRSTGKTRYPTFEAAMKAVGRVDGQMYPVAATRCTYCGSYHMTKRTK